MTTILIVDDHQLMQASLSKLLAEEPTFHVIAAAINGEEALEQIRKQKPDIVIMDINMPGMGGLAATKRIHQLNPNIKILILSAYSQEAYIELLIHAGAHAVLTKGCSLKVMKENIYEVLQKDRQCKEKKRFNFRKSKTSPLSNLTPKELEVLLLIAQGNNNQSIAKRLFLSIKTIHNYRYRLFEKLKVQNDVELACLSMHHGLL